MKPCEDCNTTENVKTTYDDFNRQEYNICDDCNEIRYENFLGDYY